MAGNFYENWSRTRTINHWKGDSVAFRNETIRECLRALDDLRENAGDRSEDWKAGVEASRAILRSMIGKAQAIRREPLEPGSLAERVVAHLRIRRGTVLTDQEISDRFEPHVPAADVWFHLQVAVRDEYLETTVAGGRSRGYRAWGCSAELAQRRKYG